MDISLNLAPSTSASAMAAPLLERAITTKVPAIEAADKAATLPANKPFVAQVVTARLSGAEFPENPTEIAPPDRTLRPYDVPMLPYEEDGKAKNAAHGEDQPSRSDRRDEPGLMPD